MTAMTRGRWRWARFMVPPTVEDQLRTSSTLRAAHPLRLDKIVRQLAADTLTRRGPRYARSVPPAQPGDQRPGARGCVHSLLSLLASVRPVPTLRRLRCPRLEALSRGAGSATLVESDPDAVAALRPRRAPVFRSAFVARSRSVLAVAPAAKATWPSRRPTTACPVGELLCPAAPDPSWWWAPHPRRTFACRRVRAGRERTYASERSGPLLSPRVIRA